MRLLAAIPLYIGVWIVTYRWSRAGHEDQRSEVCSTLVGKSTSSVQESTNTVGLDGRADNASSPCGGGRSSLLGLDELLLAVGGLGAVVGVTEDWAENGEGGGVVENRAEGNGGWLDWWKI